MTRQNPPSDNSGSEKPKEPKDVRFKRVAGKRTADALAKIDLLAGTATKTNYEYTDEQVKKITDALDGRVAALKERFASGGEEKATFDL